MKPYNLISDATGVGPQGEFLRNLKETIHVVLDFFLFQGPPGTNEDAEYHRSVAEHGMAIRSERNEEYFLNLRKQVLEDPVRFEPIDPEKLGPEDRFSIEYDITKARSERIEDGKFLEQYRPAFLDPPFGLRCSAEEARRLCEESLIRLFGDLRHFTFRSWSNDWSNYFDAGNEWWGAYLWTAINPDGRAVWIGGSSTD